MIHESAPWRRDLLRDADILERWLAKNASERRSVLIEKKVFVGAYAMRRLLQSGKLSSSTDSRNLRLDRFPSIKEMHKHDRWDIDLHYDIKSGAPAHLTIPRLLDLIIHSFVFHEWHDGVSNEWNIVYTSDRNRNKFLWLMRLSEFVTLMKFVANDNPPIYTLRFNQDTSEWIEWRGYNNPPES